MHHLIFYRNSRSQMFFKVGALKIVGNFTERTLVLEPLFNNAICLKACNVIKEGPNTDVFL